MVAIPVKLLLGLGMLYRTRQTMDTNDKKHLQTYERTTNMLTYMFMSTNTLAYVAYINQ